MLAWRALTESTDPLQTNYLQYGEFDVMFSTDGSKESVKLDSEGDLKEQSAEEIMTHYEGVVFKKRYDSIICQTDYHTFTYQRERMIPDLDDPKNFELIEYRHKGKRLFRPRIGFGEKYNSEVFSRTGGLKRASKEKGLQMESIVRLNNMEFSDTDLDLRHPLGSVMRFSQGRFGKPIVRRTPKQLSGRFLPPPEVQRFNPLERVIAMEDAVAANDNIDPKKAKVLDVAISSPNFEVVGNQFGYEGKTAERRGKRLVLEAAKAFDKVLEALAA